MKKEYAKEFYDIFHRKARVHTHIVTTNDFTYRIVLSFLNRYLSSGEKVLDIGCGTGTISLYIASKGNEVLGIDISFKAVDAAQKSAKLLGLTNASFKAINFLDSHFSVKFHFIVCSEVLEHLHNDKIALEKIYNTLKPGGTLLLTVPSKMAPIHILCELFFKRDKFDERVGHLRRYSRDELVHLLQRYGFTLIEVKEAEGILRNFLFVTFIGNKLISLTRILPVNLFITCLDNLLAKAFGASQVITISKKTFSKVARQ